MSLHLKLRPSERFVINGAVVQNGNRPTTVSVLTKCDVLRESEILTERDARTPVAQVRQMLQLALVSPDDREQLLSAIADRLVALMEIMRTSSADALIEAGRHAEAGDYYKAYKALAPVAEREAVLLASASADG